jgi:mitochondrial enoyl-[acyl-carrier protein] reductase / trans-2-enoyl-CoA reductase
LKQIRFDTFGPAALVARCEDVADVGEPSAWEVVVDIEACSITPADIARLAGRYGELPALPATLGIEGVGRVTAHGQSVKTIAVGDRVIVVGNDNWSQRRRLAASMVVKVPARLDVLQLALLKVSACTALELVRRQAPLVQGDWIVQTAPLSSVGRAVMQIARHDGLRTLNIVRRPDAVAEVLAAGGDAAIEDGPQLIAAARHATEGAPLRLALDAVGGDGFAHVAALLARGATLINYGMLSGQPIQVNCEQTIFGELTFKGFWLTQRLSRMSHAQRDALIGEAVDLLARGVLHAPVSAVFALDAIGDALRHAGQPGRRGSVLLLPNGSQVAVQRDQ